MIWTIVPAVVLTFLVLRGFNTWSKITNDIPADSEEIEVYAYQFGWKARYAGEDKKFGQHSFTFTSGKNPLGLAVDEYVDSLSAELKNEISQFDTLIKYAPDSAKVWKAALADLEGKQNITAYPVVYKELKEKACDAASGAYVRKLEKERDRKKTTLQRIAEYRSNKDVFNNSANDDRITTEIVLVKNKPYVFKFRARDVIHSAYMPEFRAQMNCVPGMATQFAFTPTHTTEEARQIKGNKEFEYYLYCNKICGAAHYNMKIKITVVDSEARKKVWLESQAKVVPAKTAAPATDDKGEKNTKDSAAKSPTVALN
ncbi:MAG: hypothetical protein JNK73_02725 [Bacteroidia bacterium]|nr:hypothetical protein [Bacteroidia bacterium]